MAAPIKSPRYRRGVILVAPEMLPECARVILDHGLRINGSLDSRSYNLSATVALMVSGEQLPEECDTYSPARVLMLQITKENYGSQSLSRISAISVDAQMTDQFWLTRLGSQWAT